MTESTPGVDTTVPHSPRIWNYWLGGTDSYEIDRLVGDQFVQVFPQIVDIARESRGFLSRAVEHLAGEAGIRQFLDVGTGLPTRDNTHEVAQRVAADCRVVYVDNDPLVLAHAQALLGGAERGGTSFVDADLREPRSILDAAREKLDFEAPIALMLMNILGHLPDFEQARSVVAELVGALPPGSYLATADGTNVIDGPAFDAAIAIWNEAGEPTYHLRKPAQIARFFDGLELLEPGIVSCSRWRPSTPDPDAASDLDTVPEVDEFGGVGRKP